jgi:hypothetical protein
MAERTESAVKDTFYYQGDVLAGLLYSPNKEPEGKF